MEIIAKFYGNLKKYLPEKKEFAQIAVEPGTTVAALLEQFQVPDAQVWMCAVNDTVVPPSCNLQDGDVLEVFEPVGGGLA